MSKQKLVITTVLLMLGAAVAGFNLSTKRVSSVGDLKNGIVKLSTLDGTAFCSAVVISDTEALTAEHCLMASATDKFNMIAESSDGVVKVNVVATKTSGYSRDISLIKGDFSRFEKFRLVTSMESDLVQNPVSNLKSCGYPYVQEFTCYDISGIQKRGFMYAGVGQVYPGMSGGGLVDLDTRTVYAINHAMSTIDNKVFFQPTVGILNSLFEL